MAENRRLQAALVGVTAAVVGVIANLAVFFASRVLFPADGIFDLFALLVAVASIFLLQKLKVPVHFLVAIGAIVGMVWTLAF